MPPPERKEPKDHLKRRTKGLSFPYQPEFAEDRDCKFVSFGRKERKEKEML